METPGIPDSGIPTYKYRQIQRDSFEIGTAGYGYVAIDPIRAMTGASSVYSTDNTFAGNTIETTVAGVTASVPSGAIPTGQGFARPVAACICVTYDDSLLDVSGHSTSVSISAGTLKWASEAQLLSYPKAVRAPTVYGQMRCVVQEPLFNTGAQLPALSFAIRNGWFPYTASTQSEGISSVIMVVGPPGLILTYEVHFIHEFFPVYAQHDTSASTVFYGNMLSLTPPDPVGLTAVQSALHSMPTSGVIDKATGAFKWAESKAIDVAEGFLNQTVDHVSSALSRATERRPDRALGHAASKWPVQQGTRPNGWLGHQTIKWQGFERDALPAAQEALGIAAEVVEDLAPLVLVQEPTPGGATQTQSATTAVSTSPTGRVAQASRLAARRG
jgi:hypothetical protein